MTPEERAELLAEHKREAAKQRLEDERLDAVAAEAIIERDKLANGQTPEEREDWRAEKRAEWDKPVKVKNVILENMNLLRKVLDPRVILEAQDLGCGPDELERMKERMQTWADAVAEKREGESKIQRDIRLRELGASLFVTTDTGCGCNGTGLRHVVRDWRRRDGQVIPNVERLETCECERGLAKAQGIKAMSGGRRRGGRKRKKAEEGLEDVFGE